VLLLSVELIDNLESSSESVTDVVDAEMVVPLLLLLLLVVVRLSFR